MNTKTDTHVRGAASEEEFKLDDLRKLVSQAHKASRIFCEQGRENGEMYSLSRRKIKQ